MRGEKIVSFAPSSDSFGYCQDCSLCSDGACENCFFFYGSWYCVLYSEHLKPVSVK